MTVRFRDYLKAELIVELLSSIFLRGKHPRATAIGILSITGFFLLLRSIFSGIFSIFGLGFLKRRRAVRKGLRALAKEAKRNRDRPHRILSERDRSGTWLLLTITCRQYRSDLESMCFKADAHSGKLRVLFRYIDGRVSEAPLPWIRQIAGIRELPEHESDLAPRIYREIYFLAR